MSADELTNRAMDLGFQPGQVVQEIGWDEDVDDDLRAAIEELIGRDLVDEDHDDDAVDGLVLWWRDNDGDLSDALEVVTGSVKDGGLIWLMTPKAGRDGQLDPSDIKAAVGAAGLKRVGSANAAGDWGGIRLTTAKR